MARNRIAGITVEISGDTTKLTDALKKTNRDIKSTQDELKDVEKLLKLDPKNVTLLKQKQELLNKAIGETRDKLKVLKDAQKDMDKNGVDKNSEQYRGLQREIIDTEQELKSLEKQTDKYDDTLDDTGETVEKAEGKLNKFGETAKKVGELAGVAIVAAGAAAVKLGKEVIEQFGELEQNLGGSEAVFGKYYKKIQTVSEDAYKTMGVSQSEYLASANKIGALLQGSGVEQQKSLEMTTQLMSRAADVASVMGIDTASALEAVTGAAKGNYTMMDNLGVKMDNTTLKAYAAAQGFEKSFDKMSNAEKAEVALKYFFENTEQYAGNFEREATQTISGSLNLLSASFDSFIAGLGNKDADIGKLTKNLIDAFKAVVSNIVPVIQNIVNAIPQVVGALIPAVLSLLPSLLSTFTDLLFQVLDGLFKALPTLVSTAIDFAQQLVLGVVDFLVNGGIQTVVQGAVSLFMAIVDAIPKILPPLVSALPDIVLTIVKELVGAIPTLIDGALKLLLAIVDAIPLLIDSLVPVIPDIVIAINDALIKAIPQLLKAALELFKALLKALDEVSKSLSQQMPVVLAKIVDWVKSIWNKVTAVFAGVGDWFRKKFNEAFQAVKNVFSPIVDFFGGIWERIKTKFSELGTKIGNAISGAVKSGINKVISLVESRINNAIGIINGAIGIINAIPGVSVGKVKTVSFPRLYRGGVLEKGQVGILEGSGAEAVVPLENNRKWLRSLAEELNRIQISNYGNFAQLTTAVNGTVRHSGTIRIEGVNNRGEFVAAGNAVINDLGISGITRLVMDEIQAATDRRAAVY